MEKLKRFSELSEEKKQELVKLVHEYSMILQGINLFIQVNNLDYDEIWDLANQEYDLDMTYAPNEN